jgi:hypothetical protein
VALLRSLFFLALLLVFVLFGATVKIGKYTLFGHFARIWKTEATQDMVKSVEQESAPAIDRLRRGVHAGVEEATRDAAPHDGTPGKTSAPDQDGNVRATDGEKKGTRNPGTRKAR